MGCKKAGTCTQTSIRREKLLISLNVPVPNRTGEMIPMKRYDCHDSAQMQGGTDFSDSALHHLFLLLIFPVFQKRRRFLIQKQFPRPMLAQLRSRNQIGYFRTFQCLLYRLCFDRMRDN